jgi:hypothetical protein
MREEPWGLRMLRMDGVWMDREREGWAMKAGEVPEIARCTGAAQKARDFVDSLSVGSSTSTAWCLALCETERGQFRQRPPNQKPAPGPPAWLPRRRSQPARCARPRRSGGAFCDLCSGCGVWRVLLCGVRCAAAAALRRSRLPSPLCCCAAAQPAGGRPARPARVAAALLALACCVRLRAPCWCRVLSGHRCACQFATKTPQFAVLVCICWRLNER